MNQAFVHAKLVTFDKVVLFISIFLFLAEKFAREIALLSSQAKMSEVTFKNTNRANCRS